MADIQSGAPDIDNVYGSCGKDFSKGDKMNYERILNELAFSFVSQLPEKNIIVMEDIFEGSDERIAEAEIKIMSQQEVFNKLSNGYYLKDIQLHCPLAKDPNNAIEIRICKKEK